MATSFVRPVQIYVTTGGRSKKVGVIEGDPNARREQRLKAVRAAQKPVPDTASGSFGGFGPSRGRFACRH